MNSEFDFKEAQVLANKLLSFLSEAENQLREKEQLINNLTEECDKLEKRRKATALFRDTYKRNSEKRAKQVEELQKELEETKSKIILSEDNANRNGRPPIKEEDVIAIKELRGKGLSQRDVAKEVGVANGTVAKYDKCDLKSVSNSEDQVIEHEEESNEKQNQNTTSNLMNLF